MAKIVVTTGQTEAGVGSPVAHLSTSQIDQLTEAFRIWNDAAPSTYIRRVRGRYWLAFLLLRFTGARIGEVLRIDDTVDIDFRHGEVSLMGGSSDAQGQRIVPVPGEVLARVIDYLLEFPLMQGKVFALDQGNFRREFYRRSEEAQIPRELSHPHILRHTRAIELLKAGVPLTVVQDLLGHSLSSTTAIYLERTEIRATIILRDRGLL
ncbi:MAG: site-specific integrase [Syntrophobacteraceae bacterium]|nr:site-specific integrase [Desulfobacteraceae bacterium]